MADGVTHKYYLRLGWLIIAPTSVIICIIAISLRIENAWLYLPLINFNYLLCEIIDPDIDQMGITIAEGTVLRMTKKLNLGFIGALFISYSFLYSYIVGLFGGHRSWLSHGWITGTIGRMIFYNLPIYFILKNYIDISRFFDVISIYLQSQFIAWFLGDATHLILDTEWAKGRLYTIQKRENKNVRNTRS